MFRAIPNPRKRFHTFTFLLVGALFAFGVTTTQGQRKPASHAAPEEASPLFHEYRGIQLGMTAEDVRKKLGEPNDKTDEQEFYVFGETETAQVVYDKTRKVVTISADFLTSGTGVLSAKQVFGAEIEAKPDGSVYKMVRYPKAGYWLSYNRTSGASPMTSVTLQKIQ
jgi:hypothetical protein